MAETVKLATRLDLSAAQNLVKDVTAVKPETDLTLDASDVTHLGALCAQAILATANRSKSAGAALKIENVSERVEEQLGFMGLSTDKLMEGTA